MEKHGSKPFLKHLSAFFQKSRSEFSQRGLGRKSWNLTAQVIGEYLHQCTSQLFKGTVSLVNMKDGVLCSSYGAVVN